MVRWSPITRCCSVLGLLLVCLGPLGCATGGGGSASSAHSEAPAPAVVDGPLVRIAVAGDTGTGDAAERATVEAMVAHGGDRGYEALLLLGDMVYDGDAERVDETVTEPFAPLLDEGAKLLPVLGNHDYQRGEQGQIIAALGQDSTWYVDDVGPLRFVALDTERIDHPEQTRWLRDTLAEPQPAGSWTVVAMHRPAYSAGHHGSDADVRARWGPLFEEYDVPLVLAGHDHDYQRSHPIGAVVHVVSGAGAAAPYTMATRSRGEVMKHVLRSSVVMGTSTPSILSYLKRSAEAAPFPGRLQGQVAHPATGASSGASIDR